MAYQNNRYGNKGENRKMDLVKIGCLWNSEDKEGRLILSGKLGDAKLYVLQNGFKKDEKSPDFYVYVAPDYKAGKEDGGRNNSEEGPF
jgi:hypothetical protein